MSDVRIVHNRLLGGWFIVRGPHDTPISGKFDTKEDAKAHLDNPRTRPNMQNIPVRTSEVAAIRKAFLS